MGIMREQRKLIWMEGKDGSEGRWGGATGGDIRGEIEFY